MVNARTGFESAVLSGLTAVFVAVSLGVFVAGCDSPERAPSTVGPGSDSGNGASAVAHDYGDDCQRCHADHIPKSTDSPALSGGYSLAGEVTHAELLCTACHEPHGNTTNLRLIRERIATPHSGEKRVVFTSYYGSMSMADGDGTYNGLCEVCHTTTTYHTNDASGDHTHNAGSRCSGCHFHNNGQFLPMVNDCATCHNTTQPVGQGDYRRQIVSSGGVGGDFLKTSHHAYTGTGAESVTSPDCVVCHSNSKHRTLLDPQVRLFDSDTGSTITYNGTPASLETFCIACHDADGGPRFSDAKVPVNIETAWLASSHKASGLTCFGDGASTGCHANGHGSDKTALKAPFTGATPDQEAFCYVCHDADGPATSNIQIDFSGTLTLPGSSWNGAYLNTHHDVSTTDQTFSGAAIECKNCHDPHVATAAQPSLGNVDPDDGRVPAPDNTFTGSNFTTEFCMECHDNSYPAAVRPPTHVLTNLYTLWTDSQGGDQHGPSVASQSVSLRAGSGYARGDILNCDVCHDTGHGNSQNLFQLRTTIYSKNGLTPLASDAGGTTVYMTDVSAGNTNAITNGKNWCSTCHPQPMGGTKSKGCIDCHHHGDRF